MINLRPAKKEDCPFILKMIKELATFENAGKEVETTVSQLENDGFNKHPVFESVIIEYEGVSCGMALYYHRYSTWKGKTLYLEDLYINPEFRGKKLGLYTMRFLAQLAIERHCKRFEWQVLDWNEPAIEFYKRFDTELDAEWMNCRLTGDTLKRLASQDVG